MKWMYLLSAVILFSCSQNEKTESTENGNGKTSKNKSIEVSEVSDIKSAHKNLQPYTEFTYLPSSNSVFDTPRGTKINIPKNSFVYNDGTPVKENVTVKYKEFHTAGEIILSGIPMEYDSAGIKKQFQSAGMFEIRAFVAGEEVNLAQGKSIDIELASNMSGNFNFYQLNDEGEDWNMLAQNQKAVPNDRKVKRQNALKEELSTMKKPVAPKPYKPGDKIFDISINTLIFPEFSSLNGLMWQYVGSDEKNDPVLNKKFSASEWQVVRISPQQNNEYEIKFQKEDDTLIVRAVPVFQGALLTKENKKFNDMLNNFNEEYNRVIKEQKKAEDELALLRKFNLQEMGIYNYDRYYHNPDAIPLFASFDFKTKINLATNSVSVFLVPEGENAVIRYTPETYDKFGFDPTKNNTLIAVLPDKTICIYSNNGFKKIKKDPTVERQRFMFSMQTQPDKITSPNDLDKILAENK